MKKIAKVIPNVITSIRIIGAISVIFIEPFTLAFFLVYGICGVTDVLDGFIARHFHLESKIGSVLDSVSDIIFLGVMGFKILPTLLEILPIWNWVMILIPIGLHLVGYIVCAIKFKKFSALHTYANKIMSAAIFCYPFAFIGFIPAIYETYVGVFGSVAIYSSIEIILIHLIATEYSEKNKTIFLIKKNERKAREESQEEQA